jgi:PAS domain S-box-containing protein
MNKTAILIVEDEAVIADDLKETLEGMGYFVAAIVSSGEKALKKTEALKPDLVLMDIVLKGAMDGIEAADRIRTGFDIPVVYLTSHADEKTFQRAKLTGSFSYLLKPFETQALRHTIEMALYKHQADRKVRASEARYRAIVEDQTELISRILPSGTLTFVNENYCRYFNRTRSELIGSSILSLIAEEDREQFTRQAEFLSPATPVVITEFRIEAPSGKKRWHQCSLRALFDSNYHATEIQLVGRDVTERKMAEQALKDKTLQLEELNRDLDKKVRCGMEERLEREQLLTQQSKMAAMGEMIASIAHQWRQPLNAVGLIIQSLQDAYEHGEFSKEYLDKAVEDTMQQIYYMSQTIDDFRNFFKSSKEREPFDAVKAVQDTLALISPQLRNNFITVVTSDFPEALTLTGYPNEFKQVVLNIINNSKDAILEAREDGALPKNGAGTIHVSLQVSEGGALALLIRDNAGGIPDDIINKIFDPYFTTKEPGKGTGIGLYMSKIIIEKNMGGRLSVRNAASDHDRGAEFKIELQP